jgi:hypothetical protein
VVDGVGVQPLEEPVHAAVVDMAGVQPLEEPVHAVEDTWQRLVGGRLTGGDHILFDTRDVVDGALELAVRVGRTPS